jgi:hypothetical protein
VPFKGNADSTQALMGGHVMAQSDATGWGKFVDAGTFRLLVTFGDQRTRWGAPTAKELGYDVVSHSPYGIAGPKGMDPRVVKTLHDAFKKAIDDPENQKVLQQLDQVYWYKSTAGPWKRTAPSAPWWSAWASWRSEKRPENQREKGPDSRIIFVQAMRRLIRLTPRRFAVEFPPPNSIWRIISSA